MTSIGFIERDLRRGRLYNDIAALERAIESLSQWEGDRDEEILLLQAEAYHAVGVLRKDRDLIVAGLRFLSQVIRERRFPGSLPLRRLRNAIILLEMFPEVRIPGTLLEDVEALKDSRYGNVDLRLSVMQDVLDFAWRRGLESMASDALDVVARNGNLRKARSWEILTLLEGLLTSWELETPPHPGSKRITGAVQAQHDEIADRAGVPQFKRADASIPSLLGWQRPLGPAAYAALKILRLPRNSSWPDVVAAHRRLARTIHPDVSGDHGRTSNLRMAEINHARDVLRSHAIRD